MGIESDQLVFDYLSRVGDLAQQRGLSSGARMRLVAELRAQVDAVKPDTVPGVRRVLSRLGTPEAVVTAAGGSGPSAVPGPRGAPEPEPRPGLRDKLGGAARRFGTGGAGDTGGTGGTSGAGGSAAGPGEPGGVTGPGGGQGSGIAKPSGIAKGSGIAKPSGTAKGSGIAKGGGLPGLPGLPGLSGLGEGLRGLAGKVPAPRDGKRRSARAREPEPPPTASPPHLAGFDELGDSTVAFGEGADEPDWWRVEEGPFAAYGSYEPGETVPGFIGGIEIPEIRERPPGERKDGPLSLEKDGRDDDGEAADDEETEDGEAGGEHGEEAAEAPRTGVLPRVLPRVLAWRRQRAAVPEPYAEEPEPVEYVPAARPPLSPVLLLAVLLLVAGAVLGSWLALAGGWVIAYTSRRLPRGEAKFAALGVPGLIVGGLVVWLWGRVDGRWGEPIADGQLGHELTGVLPVMVRVAAVASALFLVWRMRRQPR
ncbi:hypothetical protein A6A06_05400 [Streptomyces sp. CB02923]|uniref:hypothetical protein n=1 Tax=Streptomyces sp. CB02923 TaxID=1718985 RepID=UPI00093FF90F|nr:hypothetical protein [Streptomyces sp. CB02923]OKI10046.1 hypothetical protein A6A06_05400 [Streptomyces sp. CB02923]